MSDDVWLLMMQAYWRLVDKSERWAREQAEQLPEDWRAESMAEIRAAAYPEEWATWKRGLDRLMEIYGVPEAPEGHQTHTEARETVPHLQLVPPATYDQASLF